MARPVRVMLALPTVKVMPPVALKPSPQTKMTAAMMRLRDLVKIHPVLHHVPHAHGGDHAVQDEADAAYDGGGDGVDQRIELGGEGEHDGVDGCQPHDTGIVDLGQSQHAGVLTVGGVGGAAERRRPERWPDRRPAGSGAGRGRR